MTHTNPKTPSLRERIEEILFYGQVPGYSKECVDDILLAVKEELPEKKDIVYEDLLWKRGWNAAIEEMERRLAE